MVDSIIDNVVDKDDFSNKELIIKERYDNLIEDYKKTVQNYNGIVTVYDNPTATSYPYQNEKRSSTYINYEYRDRKYESFDDYQSTFNKEYEFNNETPIYTDTLDKGYYEIIAIGAGSGGMIFSGSSDPGGYFGGCSSESGWGGAYLKIKIYIPYRGDLSVRVGKGSSGKKLLFKDNPQGYNDGFYETYYGDKGGSTEIYFDDILVCRCYGGRATCISKYNIFGEINSMSGETQDNTAGTCEKGSFISEIIEEYNGGKCTAGSFGDTNLHECQPPFDDYDYEDYGLGGKAKASKNTDDYIADDGENGYVYIKLISIDNVDYLKDDIELESDIIYTLGNENEIRRSISKSLNKMYNKLIGTEDITKDACSVIGEEVSSSEYDVSNLKKYSQIKTILENAKNNKDITVYSENVGYLSKVITTQKPGCFPEDDYILVYDNNTLRKLPIKIDEDKSFISFIYNNDINDIIYIKEIPTQNTDVDIYKKIDEKITKVGVGRYNIVEKIINEYTDPNQSDEFILPYNCNINVIVVGPGGGGGGGSTGDDWLTHGGSGGSGGMISATFSMNEGTNLSLNIGKGGKGGGTNRHWGDSGESGTETKITFNSEQYIKAKSGGGGGGSFKKNNYPPYPDNGVCGENEYNIDGLSGQILDNIKGNGKGRGNGTDNTPANWKTSISGLPSVLSGTTYGAGGDAPCKNNGGYGKDGYIKLSIIYMDHITYDNKNYYQNEGIDMNSNIILWDNYQYDLQKLNRLKEYVKTKDSWFDNDGYCQRSCQINCQTSVQKS